jgi:hypothetical protein
MHSYGSTLDAQAHDAPSLNSPSFCGINSPWRRALPSNY